VAECQRARDAALCAVAVDAAAEFCRDVWRPLLIDALQQQAVLHGLAAELRDLAGRNPGAAAAAQTIGELIGATRSGVTVAQDRSSGHRLLELLPTDPRARLEPT
jgi:hypothetical protein